MLAHFTKWFSNDLSDDIVMVGDLFEQPIVDFQVLMQTHKIILEGAHRVKTRQIYLMAGNHDLFKETEKKSYVHALDVMFSKVENVHVVLKPQLTLDGSTALFPWEYGVPALQQVEELAPHMKNVWRAIGHWDLESYGGNDDHLCPAEELTALGVHTIISGHWHLPGVYNVADIDVICTGSMEPMTHAEDPTSTLYVTLRRSDYEAADPNSFCGQYVRVLLAPGEEVAPPPTCLGFTTKQLDSDDEVERVSLGTFDMDTLLAEAFQSFEVQTPIQTYIKENLNDTTS